MTFSQFDQRMAERGLRATNFGKGHWMVTGGQYQIHWWPFSRRRTIWVEGTSRHHRRYGDIERVIGLATGEHTINPGEFFKKPKKKARQLRCAECGSPMQLKHSRFGKFYSCTRFPDCRGTHGAHHDGRPLGKPATQEVKKWRIQAHAAFDQLWKSSSERKKAYVWLSEQLGIKVKDCHIGQFDMAMCQSVIERCTEKAKCITS